MRRRDGSVLRRLWARPAARQWLVAVAAALVAFAVLQLPFGTGERMQMGLAWIVAYDTDFSQVADSIRSVAGTGEQWDLSRFLPEVFDGGREVVGPITPAPDIQPEWHWPVQGEITTGFGWFRPQGADDDSFNPGIEIAAGDGAPVVASASGRVALVEEDADGYGWVLEIDHGSGWQTRYLYSREIFVAPGETVEEGQLVGRVGEGPGGRAVLYFEMLLEGVQVDPEPKLHRGREGSQVMHPSVGRR